MRKLVNYWHGRCQNCNEEATSNHMDQDGSVVTICSHCGAVRFQQDLDIRRFMIDAIHEGVEGKDAMLEVLLDHLEMKMSWMEVDDLDSLAKILVDEQYDNAVFDAMAEDQEATEICQEREQALADAQAGRW